MYVVLSCLPPTPINYNHLSDFKKLPPTPPPPPPLTIVYFYFSGAFFHYYYYVLVRPVSVGGVVPASPPPPLTRPTVPVPVVFQRTYLAHRYVRLSNSAVVLINQINLIGRVFDNTALDPISIRVAAVITRLNSNV